MSNKKQSFQQKREIIKICDETTGISMRQLAQLTRVLHRDTNLYPSPFHFFAVSKLHRKICVCLS